MTSDIKYVANTPPKPLTATMSDGPKNEHAVYAAAARPDVWTFERLISAPSGERRSFFKDASAIIATGEDIGYRLAFEALKNRSKARVLIIFHGHSAYSPRNRVIIATLKRFGQIHWLTLSKSLRDQLIRDMAVPERQCHNLGHAADIDYFEPSPHRPSDPLIASAGTASRDFATLIDAVRPLDVPLKIAADSAWLAEPVNYGNGPLPPNVEARSFETFARLKDLYDRATVVAVPVRPVRHAAGFAVIAEAMAMARPVIATRNAAVSDFVIDGETGFLVEPGDVMGLRARLTTLVKDPDLALEMGRAARARMVSKFSLSAWADRLSEIAHATATSPH